MGTILGRVTRGGAGRRGSAAAARLRLWIVAWALIPSAGTFLASPVPATAQMSTSAPITDDEAYVYFRSVITALQQCDTEWLAGQFLPSARMVQISADGREEAPIPSQYVEDEFKRVCGPYNKMSIELDRYQLQVSSMGPVTTVRWQQTWGKRRNMTTGKTEGDIKVLTENWMDLVKEGHRIRIANGGWRGYELVPGAGKEFEAIASGDRVSYQLAQFFGRIWGGVTEMFGRLFGRGGGGEPEQRVTKHADYDWTNP